MSYFWITQSASFYKKQIEEGYVYVRPAKKPEQNGEYIKSITSGDLVFFCIEGVITYAGVALYSDTNQIDDISEIWKVKFNFHKLQSPIVIKTLSDDIKGKKANKYAPLIFLRNTQQDYCSEVSEVLSWYLLSRAGVYFKGNEIIELEKSKQYRHSKSASDRVSNLNVLMSPLKREDVLETINAFENINYHDYKFQRSSTYDLEYNNNLYPPKVIFGMSAIAVINRALFADEFTGGLGSVCFKVLNSLGFNIINKPDICNNSQENMIESLVEDVDEIKKIRIYHSRSGNNL